MDILDSPAEQPAYTLAELHARTAATAQYTDAYDQDGILRSGLVEEVFEYVQEIEVDVMPDGIHRRIDRYNLEGEIGDILWYVSEISRSRNLDPFSILGEKTLDAFQAEDHAITKPVVDADEVTLELADYPEGVLTVAALRVVDVMNPKHDKLWLPDGRRLDLGTALKDLVIAAGFIATQYDVRLSAAAEHTLIKLRDRQRKPHVIDASAPNRMLESRRDRLMLPQHIAELRLQSLIDQAGEKVLREKEVPYRPV